MLELVGSMFKLLLNNSFWKQLWKKIDEECTKKQEKTPPKLA